MYYLKIGKMWVSDVEEDQCLMSENMLNGWTYEQDAVSDAKIAARLTGMDVFYLNLKLFGLLRLISSSGLLIITKSFIIFATAENLWPFK